MALASFARNLLVGASLTGVAVASGSFAAAQQNNAVSGGLAGYVTDSTGAAVPGAKIKLVGPQQTIQRTSDATGHYEVRGLTPGQYTLTVVAPGFQTFVSRANEVTIDHTESLDAKLSIGEEAQTVEVDAGATQIDTENTSVNTELTDTFLEQLPVPRNVSGAFYIAPGVVSGGGTGAANPSIGGSSGLENNYTADGVTITDQAYGGLGVYTPQYGSLGTGITLSFVKEVDVKTEAFEPKYGQGDGGIVEIVTKSGSNKFHGELTAYLTPEFAYVKGKQLADYNYVNLTPTQFLSSPQYELSATFGGYILKDKLFFFGAFDPTLNRNVELAAPNAPLFSQGSRTLNTTSINWAGKLTFTPFAATILEASSYGDPSRHNNGPNGRNAFSGTSFKQVSDSYNFGTRNSTLRLNTSLFKGLTGFGAYAYSTEHFNDSPQLKNSYSISDRTGSQFVPYGFGTYYKTKDANYTLQGELQESVSFLGKHVASIGYFYNHVDFNNSTLRSGPNFAIPANNAAGQALTTIFVHTHAAAIGQSTNASFYLISKDSHGHPLTGCTYCAMYNGQLAYLQQVRGTYAGSVVAALSRYKAAFGNEVYSPNRFVTINAGLRWEEQKYGGALLTYNWSDNWSPRLGFTVDPFGDRKSKIFVAFSRYQNPLPLDAAIRQLGNEQDDTSLFYAPVKDASGNAVLDANGSVTPDTSVVLNGTERSTATGLFGAPNFSSSTGEGILAGTKMEYANEYVLGVERQVTPGMVFKAHYVDRQFGRIVEDIGSQSPEGSFVDGSYAGGIANVTAGSDYFVNEKEVTYTPAQFAAANQGCDPSQIGTTDKTSHCYGVPYTAPVAGCTAANDTSVANGGFFQHFDGTPYNGACVTNAAAAGQLGPDGKPAAGQLGSDGKPDGFANPRRHYQGLELELDRTFRNHWQARVNYRYAKLFGNYEGLYRNDNGQSDPGISSLFDFTAGAIGVLGDQFKRGYLNTDRRHVGNLLVAYTFDRSMPRFGRLNGVTVGTWIHGLSGVPLSAYESHPVYTSPGEVPVGGRGTIGRTPAELYADASVSDTIQFHDTFGLHLAFDGFNITNSQPATNYNQNLDTSPGVSNPDYNRPNGFVNPFHARFTVGLSF